MEETKQGVIRSVGDEGSIILLLVEADDGHMSAYATDANMLRRAAASIGKPLVGLRIEYGETDWPGGIEWFSIIEPGYVVCPDCRGHIPPHLDPDACFFGMHRRKTPPPTNGVHDDEA